MWLPWQLRLPGVVSRFFVAPRLHQAVADYRDSGFGMVETGQSVNKHTTQAMPDVSERELPDSIGGDEKLRFFLSHAQWVCKSLHGGVCEH